MSYTRFMDRSLDEMAADMRHPRGNDRDSRGDTDDRTLFVANLNYATSWQELRDHLRKGIHPLLLVHPLPSTPLSSWAYREV